MPMGPAGLTLGQKERTCMNFESLLDVLRFAVSKEQASQRFYLDLAAQMNDTGARRIFEAIAAQEQKHEEALKLEILKEGYTLPQDIHLSLSEDYDWQEHLELDPDSRDMNYVEALLLAIQKERASFQLYTQLIGMTRNPVFHRTLMELAEEEMRHVIQFEREYEAVSH